MTNGKWAARLERAADLASEHTFAAEALRFYIRITEYQQTLASFFDTRCGAARKFRAPGTLRQELDLSVLLPHLGPFLSLVESCAPSALAQSARELREGAATHQQETLTEFWRADADAPSAAVSPAEPLLCRIFLQPYAEYLAEHTEHPPFDGTSLRCPLCSGKPQAGILRPEGDGAKRWLLCSLCASEWEFRRIVCPACGEEDAQKLAVYTTGDIGHMRVEACDTCRHYIKTVDLTQNGRAVPVVDELAMIPLDLWATEHGYRKIQTNVLGL